MLMGRAKAKIEAHAGLPGANGTSDKPLPWQYQSPPGLGRDPTAQLWNEDCITGMAARLADNSVHLTVTSPPFEDLFVYSGAVEDVGNSPGMIDPRVGRFGLNMRYVIHQLYRVTAPGCNACIHVQQLIAHKNQHGYMGRRDFRGAIIELFTAPQAGGNFRFTGEFVIKKDQRRMAKKTKLHSLQFKSGYARTSTMWAPAVNDYVLIFQKPGEIGLPVRPLKHANNPHGWMTREEWIRDAAGVWTDIMEIDVIDGARSPKQLDRLKEANEERHVCPLQLEVILRCQRLYSNPISIQPDVLVLDPFAGIASVLYMAVGGASRATGHRIEEPRNAVGFELKKSYHRQGLRNIERALKREPVVRERAMF
jgi:hypothetical protein